MSLNTGTGRVVSGTQAFSLFSTSGWVTSRLSTLGYAVSGPFEFGVPMWRCPSCLKRKGLWVEYIAVSSNDIVVCWAVWCPLASVVLLSTVNRRGAYSLLVDFAVAKSCSRCVCLWILTDRVLTTYVLAAHVNSSSACSPFVSIFLAALPAGYQ